MTFVNKYNQLASRLKPFVPEAFRSNLRKRHQKYVFRKSLRAFKNNLHQIENRPDIVNNLIYGWGNIGWSALGDYLLQVIIEAKKTSGPILECGSGLSTILIGIIAQDRNIQSYSLEHTPEWAERVKRNLEANNVTNARVLSSPIKNYGDFEWYTADMEKLPESFQLVICDGPPGDTLGGRYGLMPIMKDKLAKGAIILFDDYIRTGEKDVLNRWKEEVDMDVEILGSKDFYAKIIIRGN